MTDPYPIRGSAEKIGNGTTGPTGHTHPGLTQAHLSDLEPVGGTFGDVWVDGAKITGWEPVSLYEDGTGDPLTDYPTFPGTTGYTFYATMGDYTQTTPIQSAWVEVDALVVDPSGTPQVRVTLTDDAEVPLIPNSAKTVNLTGGYEKETYTGAAWTAKELFDAGTTGTIKVKVELITEPTAVSITALRLNIDRFPRVKGVYSATGWEELSQRDYVTLNSAWDDIYGWSRLSVVRTGSIVTLSGAAVNVSGITRGYGDVIGTIPTWATPAGANGMPLTGIVFTSGGGWVLPAGKAMALIGGSFANQIFLLEDVLSPNAIGFTSSWSAE